MPAAVADHGFALTTDHDGTIRLRRGDEDWLGPGRHLGAGLATLDVSPTDTGWTLELRAHDAVDASSPAGFSSPATGLRFSPGERAAGARPAGLRAFAHQHTEFGLPVQTGPDLDRWFHLPFRPTVASPLWLCDPDGPTVLLAPLDGFHEQVLAFAVADDDPFLTWGWHGDLAEVPAGFATRLAVLVGDSPRTLLATWAGMLDVAPRLAPDHDTLGRQVSYWTDNGAAYWYRTEPRPGGEPRTVTETVGDAVAAVEAAGVPIGAVQLDSWFYPHETTRPFDTDEWVVPPSGLLDWTPRDDILPAGIAPLRDAVDDRPLVAHCRHLSKKSPLVGRFDCWTDDEYAHPVGSDYYEAFLDRAVEWGVETFEHDWLVECFTGVRGLRAAPGRARAWQEGIDAAAAARDLTLQWCMATPADLCQTATLGRVTSVRTSGDHGYLVGPGFLWAWFCYTNALARVLGLAPFKDVFHSDDAHGEVEALLSALSTGPVGVGDRIGATDAAVVLATCRADGVIVRPDVPLAAVDACYRQHAVARPVPLVAETHTDHAAGRWLQVFAANTYRGEERIEGPVDLGPAAPTGEVVLVDLRTGAVAAPTSGPPAGWSVALEPGEWTHHLLAPVLPGRIAVFGDRSKHAPVGRSRVAGIETVARAGDGGPGVAVRVDGPEPAIRIDGWSAGAVGATVDGRPVEVDHDEVPGGTGRTWSVTVPGGTTVVVG